MSFSEIKHIINREKTTPERNSRPECAKSSNEILFELFGALNAAPPKIDDVTVKKSKKSKQKHKKEKMKQSWSTTTSSDSDISDYSHKRKKKTKSKFMKRKNSDRCSPYARTWSPVLVKQDPEPKTPVYPPITTEDNTQIEEVKTEPKAIIKERTTIQYEETVAPSQDLFDPSLIPMPESPKDVKLDLSDLRFMLESRKLEKSKNDKSKDKIQIKNLKFSAVFIEAMKKAEEEARRRAKKCEDGENTDTSSSSAKDNVPNSQFPKSSDPWGVLKRKLAEESKLYEDGKGHSKRSKYRGSHYESSRKRSHTMSRCSRSPPASRRYHGSSCSSQYRRRRSTSRSPVRARLHSPRHRGRIFRSPTGVRLADSEKKRLLEVARRNAINMLQNGVVPAGAAALPPHTRNQIMAAIQSGGKSVDELTDFCKHLSKSQALGKSSTVTSYDMIENADTRAFHHPFLVEEKAPNVMNIRGGAPLPIKNSFVKVANNEQLRLQFPVSSGSQHRETAIQQTATFNSKLVPAAPLMPVPSTSGVSSRSSHFPVLAPPFPPPCAVPFTMRPQLGTVVPALPALPAPNPRAYPPNVNPPNIDMALIISKKIAMIRKEQEEKELIKAREFQSNLRQFTGLTGAQIQTLRAPASGPQAWSWPKFGSSGESNLGQFAGSTAAQIMPPRELATGPQAWSKKFGSSGESNLGQFTGSTGAQILTPREPASGPQAWAKKFGSSGESYLGQFTGSTGAQIMPPRELATGPQAWSKKFGTSGESNLGQFTGSTGAQILTPRKPASGPQAWSWPKFGSSGESNLGQFTGSTGAQILTPREPASGPQAWAKKFGSSGESNLGQFTGSTSAQILTPREPASGPQAWAKKFGSSGESNLGQFTWSTGAQILTPREPASGPQAWAKKFGSAGESNLGQFTGSTGAQILTPREPASGPQAWAKKPRAPPLEKRSMQFAAAVRTHNTHDELVPAAPVEGGMEMHLLQKMGWAPGQGLGKEGTGTTQPLNVKLDTRGLQTKEEQRFSTSGQTPLIAGRKHPVSLLGEYCSKQKLEPPQYNMCLECGPDYKKKFLFKVKAAGVECQPAVASVNKKHAKADAARLALQKLGILTQ